MWYRSRNGKKITSSLFFPPFLSALFFLPSFQCFLFFSLSLALLHFFFLSSWIMNILLLYIEQQHKVISGSVYFKKKVINDKTIMIKLESVSWFIYSDWTLDSHWRIIMKDETSQMGINRFSLMGINEWLTIYIYE